MSCNVFTYGSLMFPAVWGRVVRGRYQAFAAELKDYARYAVKDETYPGMIAQSGATVQGVVYLNVAHADIVLLDNFEGDAYRRQPIEVQLADGTRLPADTYLFLVEEKLTRQRWLPQAFELQRFLQTYCATRLTG